MTDTDILHHLAEQVAEVAAAPAPRLRRRRWQALHDGEKVEPLVHVKWGMAMREIIAPRLICTDPWARRLECVLRSNLFTAELDDDSIVRPLVAVPAVHRLPGPGPWGLDTTPATHDADSQGLLVRGVLARAGDLNRVRHPGHVIEESASAERLERTRQLVGAALPVRLDRSPCVSPSLSNDLGLLRGIENLLYDCVEDPDGLAALARHLAAGVDAAWTAAEQAGDLRAWHGRNQAELPCGATADPDDLDTPCARGRLWGFFESQEFTAVSPHHWRSLLLEAQKTLMAKYARVAYGCCEDLTHKLPDLLAMANVTRIAVTLSADVAACAAAIGDRRVISWRPNPAQLVCVDWNAARTRRLLEDGLRRFRACGCRLDITLKDVATVGHDPARLRAFVGEARRAIDAVWN